MRTAPALRNVAVGLAAGLVGTVVMTFGQRAEMALTGRSPSKVPAEAAEKVTGIDVADATEERQLATAVHFAYGTALGAGLAAIDDLPDPARTILAIAGAQATGMATLQALDLDGKPSGWSVPEAAVDVGHHIVYGVTASLAYRGIQRLLAGR